MNTSRLKSAASGAVSWLKSYANVREDLEPQADIEASIRSGVSFKGSQLLVLIFAIFIASLGLNTDSIPVIIGAMLISPLMGPIIGMGLAIGIEDYTLLRRGLINIGMAILGSLLASALYFMISPQYEGSSQLLARTTPSIYDVFVALFGGSAGIVSLACRNKGQVMPGVAIATSLMPPLCTAGYGLATLQSQFFFGALYLFFTNMIFILFATWIGVKLMGFKRIVHADTQRAKRVQMVVYSIVSLTVAVSAFLTFQMIRRSIFINKANSFVENQMVFPNTQVLSHSEYIKGGKRYIDVTLIGEALPKDSLQLAMLSKLDSLGLGGTILNIKQGFAAGSGYDTMESADRFYSLMQQQLAKQQGIADSLREVIRQGETLSRESARIAPEVRAIFPEVQDIAMSRMVASSTDGEVTDTVNLVLVNAPQGMSATDRKRLTNYIGVRFNCSHIHLLLNPDNFPWPHDAQQSPATE